METDWSECPPSPWEVPRPSRISISRTTSSVSVQSAAGEYFEKNLEEIEKCRYWILQIEFCQLFSTQNATLCSYCRISPWCWVSGGRHTWPVLVTSPITPDPPGNKINEDLCLTSPGPPMTSLRLNTNLSQYEPGIISNVRGSEISLSLFSLSDEQKRVKIIFLTKLNLSWDFSELSPFC